MPLPLLLASVLVSAAAPDSSAEDLVRAMHDRYAGRWPTETTFVQTSTFHEADSTRSEIWYEATGSPSKLRIDFAPLENGNGVIFRGDSVYQFKSDSLVAAVPRVHPLMVLSRDVYVLPVEETLAKLRDLGFDLAKVREETWQGRPAYVVGADAGDLESPQFWIDKENLLFVRLIEPAKQDPGKTEEIQFNEYRRLEGGWIETEVLFFLDGKLVFEEHYEDMREAPELEDALFDPGNWGRPSWVKEEKATPAPASGHGEGEEKPPQSREQAE